MKNDWIILDVETTGTDKTADHVVEIALVSLNGSTIGPGAAFLVKPPRPIPSSASAIHHLMDRDVAGAPSLESLAPKIRTMVRESGALVAHNAAFDSSFLPFLSDLPWICTYRLARHLWPDLDAYGNQALRYRFGLDLAGSRASRLAHSALDDARVTAHLLRFLIEEIARRGEPTETDALVRLSAAPITVEKMPFGKHKGVRLEDLPSSYVEWLLKNEDTDADLRSTLLQMRKKGAVP